ncbi:transglycosylase SLT domain-containing protein [Patescibacteria group bacterium]|nr:transglycosylase SLT domain-containing protein [Patescibacteria group bacterium]
MRALLVFSTLGGALVATSALAMPVFADTVPITSGNLVLSEGFVSSSVPNVTEPTESDDAPAPFVVFRMADGRFFNPTSGKLANSEAELRALVYGTPIAESTNTNSGLITSADTASTTIPLVDPLIAAIRSAQAELSARVSSSSASNAEKIVKNQQDWLEVTIAIWDRKADQLRYIDAKMRGTQLIAAEDTESNDDTFKVLQANGLNSNISVNGDPDQIVVAIQYPILEAMNAKKTLFSVRDVVYVPYSSALRTPALVQAGEEYLDSLADQVFTQLRADGIRSRAYPDRLLADVIDPAMVKSIAAIEHVDQASLENNPDTALERFFVTLGTNKGSAYNYSRSTAGALGLVQFIPSTYNHLVVIDPDWKLNKDFQKGMQDHANAIRAQIIYFDTLLLEFPSSVRAQYLVDPGTASEYVVAAYNGGSGRVRRAIAQWAQIFNGQRQRQLAQLRGQYSTAFAKAESLRVKTLAEKNKTKRAALQKQLDAQRKVYRSLQAQVDALQASILRNETIGYVQKYRLTRADDRFTPRNPIMTTVSASTHDVLLAP